MGKPLYTFALSYKVNASPLFPFGSLSPLPGHIFSLIFPSCSASFDLKPLIILLEDSTLSDWDSITGSFFALSFQVNFLLDSFLLPSIVSLSHLSV